MEKQQVRMEIENAVMRITIDHPETKNGLDWMGLEQLADCYQRLIDDESIRVGVVTAAGDYFYTGGRVDPKAPGEQEKYSAAIRRATEILGKVPKPVIAILNGHCLKAGMAMLAASDIAIAKEGIRFGFPEVRMGGVPMMVLVDVVDRMPSKKAVEALLTSWEFSAEEALQMGLVNCIVPEEKLEETAQKYVRAFLDTPRELIEMTLYAYREVKKIGDRDERFAFAFDYLSREILPTMEKLKQEYNV